MAPLPGSRPKSEPAASKGAPWLLIVTSVVGAVMFTAGILLFPMVSRSLTERAGLPCDRPSIGEQSCVPFEEAGGLRDPDRALPDEAGDFIRVSEPNTEIEIWIALGSLALVVPLGLGVQALKWRSELAQYDPISNLPWGAKSIPNAVLTGVVGLAGLIGGITFAISGEVLAGFVVSTLWIGALPCVLSVLDCWTIAVDEATSDQISGRELELVHFQALHRRIVAILGVDLALFVVWFSADSQLHTALRVAELARQGGTYAVAQSESGAVVAYGLLLSGLLAIAFLPTSARIRELAQDYVDRVAPRSASSENYVEVKKERDERMAALKIDVPLTSQFEQALLVTAPLLSSLASTYLPL